MSHLRGILILSVLLAAAASRPAQAQEGTNSASARPSRDWKSLSSDPDFRERLRRWQSMSAEEKERIRARHREWQELPEADRGRLVMNLVRFRSLPAGQQEEMRERLRQLPPEKQQRLRQCVSRAQSFTRQHQIPVGFFMDWVRKTPREEMDRIRGLPPEERRAAAREMIRRFQEHAAERFAGQIPESEREAFRALPVDERLSRLRKWFAERNAREEDGPRHRPPLDAPPRREKSHPDRRER